MDSHLFRHALVLSVACMLMTGSPRAQTSAVSECHAMADAERLRRASGRRTIVFIDEIHRFNKAQQDAFLPRVEAGDIVLIGATTGTLKVTTTGFRAGYLRKNGVPYSEAATITEYFHRLPDSGAGDWLHVLTIVEDPRYLNDAFLTSTHFTREPNGSKWNPTECRTAPPPPPPG